MSDRPGSKPTRGRGGASSSGARGAGTGARGKKPSGATGTSKAVVPRGGASKAVVPRGSRQLAAKNQEQSLIVPEGYTMRKIEPAKNYDAVSFARAMNPDFGPRVKKLFDPEREAAIEAQQTGIYIGWRCPDFKHDCQRVSSTSKCFCGHLLQDHAKYHSPMCGHLLQDHAKYNARSYLVPCKQSPCKCKGFAWIPSRPEEIGEFWFARRRDFDPAAWRAKCRCKHTHEEHDPTGLRRCKTRGCGCAAFDSPFLCAACDRHWEQHETYFENANERQKNGLPVGADYLPFAEIPSLRNMVLTGEDDGDMTYMRMMDENQHLALPPSGTNPSADNSTPFPGYGGQRNSGFKPTYD